MNSAQEQEGRSEACRQHLYGCNRCKKTIHICISLQPPLKQDAISSGGTTENGRADKERGKKESGLMFSSCICYLTENSGRIQINPPHAQTAGIL